MEIDGLGRAVWAARARIVVFLVTILIAVTIAGTAMYVVERSNPRDSHFTSVPQAMYWAVVTMTTVGYGDVVPQTTLGKILSTILILLGYSLIIVPTGFISAELAGGPWRVRSRRECPACGVRGHKDDARFCRRCAAELTPTGE
jgi:voltage-gated potassium channel